MPMIIQLPLYKYSPQELDETSDSVIPEGKYHIRILSLIKPQDEDCVRLGYQVLNGTDRTAIGATCSERFYLSEGALKRLAILAKRCGLLEGANPQQAAEVDYDHLIGRELVVETKNEQFTTKKGEEKTSTKWTFSGFWLPTDERVAGVPKAGQTPPAGQAGSPVNRPVNAPRNGAGATQPAPTTQEAQPKVTQKRFANV